MFEIGKRLYTDQKRLLPVLMVGILTGIVIICMTKSILLGGTGLFNEYILCRMKYMSVDKDALFFYILRKRLISFITIAVMSTTYLGMLVCLLSVIRYGVAIGMYLATLSMRYGIKGLCLAVVGVMPQCFFYIPCFIMLLKWCEDVYRSIYFKTVNGNGYEKASGLRQILKLLLIGLLNVVGCILEGYLNPQLLTGFLKIF